MNFGFKLAKPAESDLGIAMRLWQSNSASWKVASTLDEYIEKHRGQLSRIKMSAIKDAKGIDLIRSITNEVLSWTPYNNVDYMYAYPGSFKQCIHCSKLGYHSFYFMMPWLSHCPVHGYELTAKCPTCNKSCLRIEQIQRNKCPTCRIVTSKERLVALGAYDVEKWERAFAPLDKFVKGSARPVHYRQTHLEHLWAVRTDQMCRLRSLPSVLTVHQDLSNLDITRLRQNGINLVDCYQFKFKLGTDYPVSAGLSKVELRAMASVRKKVLRKAQRAITKFNTSCHKLHDCLRNRPLEADPCLYCCLALIIRCAQSEDKVPTYKDLFRVYLGNRTVLRFDDPGFVTEAHDRSLQRERSIPLWISKIMYFVDLWMLFRQVVVQVQHYNAFKSLKKSMVSHMQGRHCVLHPGTGPIVHCHLFIDGDLGQLIFPKYYLSKILALEQSLLNLTEL